MSEYTELKWPTETEDDEGNEYFTCPYCDGSGIACKGSCLDMGDEHTSIMVQVEPDWPCGMCDSEGLIKKGSENHFCLIRNKFLEILIETFGQENIDKLPKSNFNKLYTSYEHLFDILKIVWTKSQSRQSVTPKR